MGILGHRLLKFNENLTIENLKHIFSVATYFSIIAARKPAK